MLQYKHTLVKNDAILKYFRNKNIKLEFTIEKSRINITMWLRISHFLKLKNNKQTSICDRCSRND